MAVLTGTTTPLFMKDINKLVIFLETNKNGARAGPEVVFLLEIHEQGVDLISSL